MDRRLVLLAACVVLTPRAGRADDPAALVRRAVDAAGGADRLLQARRAFVQVEGTLTAGGAAAPFRAQLWRDLPDRYRAQITLTTAGGPHTETTVMVRGAGWHKAAARPAAALEGAALQRELVGRYAARVTELVSLLENGGEPLAPLGEEAVGRRPADGVKVTRKDYPDVSLWFDRESGLLVKSAVHHPLGLQVQYRDEYRDFGGLKWPVRTTVYRDGVKVCEDRVTEFRLLDSVDDALFRQPD